MKILYGTANQAKLKHMRDMLDGLGLDIIGLDDVNFQSKQIDENGNTPLENARIKASAYYGLTKMPVFSCDSGLYIEGLEDEKQPGVHVRRVQGKTLNDEEMIEYYTDIARNFGGTVRAKYKNAICLILDEKSIFEYDGDDIASVSFLITSKAHPKRTKGFPLDSISLELKTGKYYMDLNRESESITGFRDFFARIIKQNL